MNVSRLDNLTSPVFNRSSEFRFYKHFIDSSVNFKFLPVSILTSDRRRIHLLSYDRQKLNENQRLIRSSTFKSKLEQLK